MATIIPIGEPVNDAERAVIAWRRLTTSVREAPAAVDSASGTRLPRDTGPA